MSRMTALDPSPSHHPSQEPDYDCPRPDADAAAKARGDTSRAIVQGWLETWQQLAIDFQQTKDPGLREAVAVHVGATLCDLERGHERATTPRDRTISQDARYRSGLVILPIVDALIATADADQLRHVIHGMTARLGRLPLLDDLIATTDADELRYVIRVITCMTAIPADDDLDDDPE